MVSTVLLVSVAVSVDSLVTGVFYGLKGLALPVGLKCLVSMESAAAISAAVVLGCAVAGFVPATVAKFAGGLLLMGLGIAAIIKGHGSSVIRLLSEPELADVDSSGQIDLREAVVLGIALAMDCFGMGLGLALTGTSWLAAGTCCGLGCLVSMCVGELAGKWFAAKMYVYAQAISALPGMVMILLGLSHFI
ncbi:MAG: manganese efflux pump [Bacillota bacterium]